MVVSDLKKAQSAIEYLMTYGWMLLVVAVVGGAVFSITSGQDLESTSGFTGSDVQVEEFGLTNNEELQLVLRNADSNAIDIQDIRVSDGEQTVEFSEEQNIAVSDTETVLLEDFAESSESNDLDVSISYDSGALTGLEASGSISGQLEILERDVSFSFDPEDPEEREDVTFTSEINEGELEGSIEQLNWDFDDSSTDQGEEVQHDFNEEGSYAIELEAVTTEDSYTVTRTVPVSESETEPASVETLEASEITGDSAELRGNITNEGGEEPEVRFNWGTTEEDLDEVIELGTSTGEFSETIEDLDSETSYYFQAEAENSGGTSTGETLMLETEGLDTMTWTIYEWSVSDQEPEAELAQLSATDDTYDGGEYIAMSMRGSISETSRYDDFQTLEGATIEDFEDSDTLDNYNQRQGSEYLDTDNPPEGERSLAFEGCCGSGRIGGPTEVDLTRDKGISFLSQADDTDLNVAVQFMGTDVDSDGFFTEQGYGVRIDGTESEKAIQRYDDGEPERIAEDDYTHTGGPYYHEVQFE